MAVNSVLFTINFPGGIISPGHLYELMQAAAEAQVDHVRFGHRQQLLLEVPARFAHQFGASCKAKDIHFYTGSDFAPNIMSAYAAEGIFITDSWLSEGVYKDVLDLFDYTPRVKINICDGDQTFVPFFTGNINWIASPASHFWYLFIRYPGTNTLFGCPDLLYTNDIVPMSRAIEKLLSQHPRGFYQAGLADGPGLYQKAKQALKPVARPVENELHLPAFRLPYYEGFNRQGNGFWLGIYLRNETFPVLFLRDLSRVCVETKLGEIYSTPWKSLIIKGIAAPQRKLWDQLLGKYRINVRHAANELNWQVEDNNEDGLVLKRHVIRYFDKEDVRTYGLCFAVKTVSASGIFGSVIIRRETKDARMKLKSQERYEILYTADFNPNSSEYILFRDNVKKEHLGPYLVSLCKMFYESGSDHELSAATTAREQTAGGEQEPRRLIHQCRHCLSVYDTGSGEPENGIPPGTAFESLPDSYTCPLCESAKSDFMSVYVKHVSC